MSSSVDPWADTASTTLRIDGCDTVLVHPRNSDDLITEEEFTRDERMPYWADIWPASHVLAAHLARENGTGRRLIELGCGLGLASIAAVRAGFRVLATDYYGHALEFARYNVRHNTGAEPETLLLDWREQSDLREAFDVAAASDVLYERAYATLIPRLLDDALRPGGSAIIADPGRVAAPDFLQECERIGFRLTRHTRHTVQSSGHDIGVDLYTLQKEAGSKE